ncbi:MAG: hypothetical protein LUG89_05635 [Methanosphaera sp.]|nr:hypothetical protein [Methanosphaera sp.]
MPLIATSHLFLIIEVAILMHFGIMLLLNYLKLNFTRIVVLSLILGVGITVMFGYDAICLLLPMLSQNEFTHPYGSIAIMIIVTAWTVLPILREQNSKIVNLQLLIIIMTVGIAIFGGLVHRDFLIMYILGLIIGFLILNYTFRQGKNYFTLKNIALIVIGMLILFGGLEILSQILNMEVISPLSRIDRMNSNQLSSIQMVMENTTLTGHAANSTYWGNATLGNSDGYISLPLTFVKFFGLPFPIFYGTLVSRKDVIDYFLPGIFGVGFDFGYITLALIMIWVLIVIIIGLKVLVKYKAERERGSKRYLGREALLTGSLTAFIAQTILGFFVITRTINGSGMLSYIFLSAMVVAHVVTTKR